MTEKKIQTGLRLPKKQYDRVNAIAERTGASINSVMLQLIDVGLDKVEKIYTGTEPCSAS